MAPKLSFMSLKFTMSGRRLGGLPNSGRASNTAADSPITVGDDVSPDKRSSVALILASSVPISKARRRRIRESFRSPDRTYR